MANFDVFLPHLLAAEGGYVNRPDDPGGETNRGITLRLFGSCAQRVLGIPGTSQTLKALTAAQAGAIYKEIFWDAMRGDEFTSQRLANQVCDFYVNAGLRAIRLLQELVGSDVDGMMGPATIAAMENVDADFLYREYKRRRIEYYEELGKKMPQFVKGWLNRVEKLE